MVEIISSPSSSYNTLLKPCNSTQHPKKSIQSALIIPSSLTPIMNNLTSAQIRLQPRFNSNNNRWKKTSSSEVVLAGAAGDEDYGGKRRRCAKVVKSMAENEREYAVEDKENERYRYTVVCLVAFVMCLCSADRTVMSVAIVPLAHTHAWSTSFVGIVQSSFLWGYIVSSVIGGAMADKLGGTRVMAWGVALWSLATLLTPWAANHSAATLLVVRAVFGLAEGVAFPAMNILLSRWFPIHERARAVGISMAGFQLGNVLGLCLTPILMSLVGISGPFVLWSALGLLWTMVWIYGVANDPKQSPFVSKLELQLIQAGKTADSSHSNRKNLSQLLSHLLPKRPFWAIVFANFTNNWGYFVLLSWMPIYFKTVLNVNLREAAWFSAIPWGVMAVSSFVAGSTSDYLTKAGYSLILVRKIMQSIGFVGPGLSLLCLNYATSPGIASIILTIALSLSSFTQAGYFLNIQDIAPHSAGLVHGITNAVGTLAAIISTIGAGYFVEWLGSFKAFLTLTSMLYFAAAIFYNLYATAERVV
ncbi:probable anion transporter 3, chloroplastic isoform X1 [Beta vulgaris subsp. vulgaris]|uniref:probable anion transporter 3, chloroplastic isoform X1 n=2 Tax=Beta vulgaris subsp. vulgaris TaxID=3555 RepID=UPI0020371C1E|nr:probable anion transporter 3, chloroplastic isoform X1 [Beta vulgaris subsp. vulgaris]